MTMQMRELGEILLPGTGQGWLTRETFYILSNPAIPGEQKMRDITAKFDEMFGRVNLKSIPFELAATIYAAWRCEPMHCQLLLADCEKFFDTTNRTSATMWATGCLHGVLETMKADAFLPSEPIAFMMRLLEKAGKLKFEQEYLDLLGKDLVDFLTGSDRVFKNRREVVLRILIQGLSTLMRKMNVHIDRGGLINVFARDVVHKTLEHYISPLDGLQMLGDHLARE